MPSILKSIFKPPRAPRRRLPSQASHSRDGDRASVASTEDLITLAADLARKLETDTTERSDRQASASLLKSKSRARSRSDAPRLPAADTRSTSADHGKKTSKDPFAFRHKLSAAVHAIENDPSRYKITQYPLQPPSSVPGAAAPSLSNQHEDSTAETTGLGSPLYLSPASPLPAALPATSSPAPAIDDWTVSYKACKRSLGVAEDLLTDKSGGHSERSRVLLKACRVLLRDQKEELGRMKPFAEDKQLPMLNTLEQVYTQIEHILRAAVPGGRASEASLLMAARVLQEVSGGMRLTHAGPDYLIDIALVECMIWQAEVIDPGYGAQMRRILDEAVGEQLDLSEFRQRMEEILKTAARPPDGAVDDELGKDAFGAIRTLAKQLRTRLDRPPTEPLVALQASDTSHSASPGPVHATPSSPSSSSASSATPSPAPTPLPGFRAHTAQSLQDSYGTGPMPSPAPSPYPSPRPSPRPSPPASPTSTRSSQKSIFEYRSHRLTRSALELVLTQERLAMADSSGQYAGEVSWDDLRNAWIPAWAEKLTPGELAEGEVPDTNPAGYRQKRRDAWGNKIGWYEGRMYYEEEPSFDLRE